MDCGTAYLLRKGTSEQKPGSVDLPQQSDEAERCVRCKKCDHKLTNLSIAPYEGTYRNPFGVSFHVVFYSDASGVSDLGSPTTSGTWFPGYGWSYAQCRQCGEHVGWWWSGRGRFIGLIATRIWR
jgi:cereblon